jgi:hypothetical protein
VVADKPGVTAPGLSFCYHFFDPPQCANVLRREAIMVRRISTVLILMVLTVGICDFMIAISGYSLMDLASRGIDLIFIFAAPHYGLRYGFSSATGHFPLTVRETPPQLVKIRNWKRPSKRSALSRLCSPCTSGFLSPRIYLHMKALV